MLTVTFFSRLRKSANINPRAIFGGAAWNIFHIEQTGVKLCSSFFRAF